jgi:excisionase family DNA binding protein
MTDWPTIVRAELEEALVQLDAEGLKELAGVLEIYRLRVERRLVTSTTIAVDDSPVDAEAIAAALGVPTSAIYDWARKKRIPSERYGRFVRFRLSAVKAALNSKTPGHGRAVYGQRLRCPGSAGGLGNV